MMKKEVVTDANFGRFWAAYPRKQAKQSAVRAWNKLKPSPELVEAMLAAIVVQSGSEQWQRGFIPHPATWLNGQRWEDQPLTISPVVRGPHSARTDYARDTLLDALGGDS